MYGIEEFDKQKTKVLKYIIYKKRTEKEIRNKFSNSIQEDLLEDIIEDLKENKYIDDSSYIKRAVDEYINLNTLSIKEIKYKLYSKGLDNDTIEDYIYNNLEKMEEYELESAKKIVLKKQSLMEKDEIKAFLNRKGYKQESIKAALGDEI